MAGDITSASINELEVQLNSFDASVRKQALTELAGRINCGELRVSPQKEEVNLHYHTFFSYNGEGWSPSRIAWETRKYGLAAAGIVDFDVLDGMEEFLSAGEIIGLRTTAAMESRVYISELSDKVINSPNEPGVAYYMVCGCYKQPDAGTSGSISLKSMRDMARQRNVQMMDRINDSLDVVRLDYDKDVTSLTPSGNATERHMLAAYDAKASEVFKNDSNAVAEFWSKTLGMSIEDAKALIENTPKLHDKIRSKLMKFGGVGYVSPTPDTFPPVEQIIEMAKDMGALPMLAWLDGTNAGEANPDALLEIVASKGSVGLNIVPDRNWNIKDAEQKSIKLKNLEAMVKAARSIDFPICIGTEMNKIGLPFVDDFSAPELQPYVNDFLSGAYFAWGHTFLARYAGIGYASEWSKAFFSDNRHKKNEFYTKIGHIAHPITSKARFNGVNVAEMQPDEVVKLLQR